MQRQSTSGSQSGSWCRGVFDDSILSGIRRHRGHCPALPCHDGGTEGTIKDSSGVLDSSSVQCSTVLSALCSPAVPCRVYVFVRATARLRRRDLSIGQVRSDHKSVLQAIVGKDGSLLFLQS